MKKIIEGTAPDKFTTEHLKKIGFASSVDRAMIGVLKDLGFISENGTPTQLYHDYRNSSKSAQILGDALKEAYSEIFHINEKPTQADRPAITGLFKSTHNVSDQVAGFMANTFLTLLNMADISADKKTVVKQALPSIDIKSEAIQKPETQEQPSFNNGHPLPPMTVPNLRYNIEIHLPATKDIEVYNSIFKALRSHLLND
jgi:hypothetical protein